MHVPGVLLRGVSPFGNPRIKGYLLLPVAYRSLSRPSSALSAKAFPLRSFQLDLRRSALRTLRSRGRLAPSVKTAYRFLLSDQNPLALGFESGPGNLLAPTCQRNLVLLNYAGITKKFLFEIVIVTLIFSDVVPQLKLAFFRNLLRKTSLLPYLIISFLIQFSRYPL